jgi:DNA polymerase-1
MPSPKKLFLIDGSALAYRSFFAFIKNPLTNSKGENTSAVFGFCRFLFKVMDEENPDYLAVVFDPPGPTFRHKQFKEYKATRQKMPIDMRDQIPKIHQVISALNIPIIEFPGYEADDVIGTLAKRAARENYQTYLVSGDKDFMQLVDDGVIMYNPKRTGDDIEILDARAVEEKIGLPPAKVVDYLGLMGDTSDNIPGVPGVGEKTAVQLIQEFGSLEAVLENAEKVSRANVRENLKAHRDAALLSKRLVVIDTAVPIDLDLESLRRKEPDNETVIRLFQELEFNSLLSRFKIQKKSKQLNYTIIDTREKLQKWLKMMSDAGQFVFHLEISEPEPVRGEITGLAVAMKPDEAFYLPIKVEKSETKRELFFQEAGDLFGALAISEMLRSIFENEAIKKCSHNLKRDLLVLARHGMEVRGANFDTMVAAYLLNPTQRQYNLESLALEHLNHTMLPPPDAKNKDRSQTSLEVAPENAAAQCACENAEVTLRLQRFFAPKLKELQLESLFENVELPLIYVLADMEKTGVALDLPFLQKMSQEMGAKLDQLIARVYEMAGEEFNINSTQQLGEILFEKLKLPRKRRTKTGYSTDVNVLEELAKVHELPRTLIEYRELMKLKSTYVDALPKLVNPETGRLHTSYNQTVTATGRLSSSDPNLQNIPIRTEIGRKIRQAFIPGDDEHVILDADYSQIELRIMAHLSGDPVLLESFQNDEDIHTKTAALVFEISPEEVTADHRRRAKEINFGIMYGMGEFGLASRLEISREEARDFITNYFIKYPKVNDFIIRTISEAREKGFVTTMLNRRRYLPDILSSNRGRREFAERTAINTPIQGTAADLIKVAMINIWRRLQKEKLHTKMIMQVHDELVFEAAKSELEKVKKIVQEEMEGAIQLKAPVKVEVGVGPNWLAAH